MLQSFTVIGAGSVKDSQSLAHLTDLKQIGASN